MAFLYKCPNIGNCDKANQGESISIISNSPAKCPECSSNLILISGANRNNKNKMIVVTSLLILFLVCTAAFFFFNREKVTLETSVPLALSISIPSVMPLLETQPLLRFHGSNTIGSELLPALAIAFLQQEGYSNVHKEAGKKEDESLIVGDLNGHHEQIEIQAHGSSTAFTDLKDNLCDIGMSSRKIKSIEQETLFPILGNLTSNPGEHVIALDGIALVVHPSNPIKTLSVKQLADIFSGKITDWSKVGGMTGKIAVKARDNKSGTYDFFNELVLKTHNTTLYSEAERFEDSHKLSYSVNNDPMSIGFVGLNYVGSNKAISISDVGVGAKKPSLLTIKTEDYLLSRRLYLYTAEHPSNPNVYKFIEFVMGLKAQQVVTSVGLVNLDVTPIVSDLSDSRNQSSKWKSLAKDATEIATRFRFRVGSDELDSRAYRDIGRIVGVLSQPQYLNKKLILIGFADSSGTSVANLKLSQSRADIVKSELAAEGLEFSHVEGLGAEAFVAPNDTPENREKNRRVEVFIK
jgi:phosphate transport system substrate-binding protein